MSGHAWHRTVAEAKKAEVVVAARDLFLERGYARTSTAEIAQHAGVSVTTLYKHFSTKEALFQAVIDWLLDRFRTALDEDAFGDGGLAEWLEAYGRRYAAVLDDPHVVGMARVIIAEAQTFRPIAERFLEAMKGETFHRMEAAITRAVATGELADHPPSDSMGAFLGHIERSVLLPRLLDPGHAVDPENSRHVVALATRSLMRAHRPLARDEDGN